MVPLRAARLLSRGQFWFFGLHNRFFPMTLFRVPFFSGVGMPQRLITARGASTSRAKTMVSFDAQVVVVGSST